MLELTESQHFDVYPHVIPYRYLFPSAIETTTDTAFTQITFLNPKEEVLFLLMFSQYIC